MFFNIILKNNFELYNYRNMFLSICKKFIIFNFYMNFFPLYYFIFKEKKISHKFFLYLLFIFMIFDRNFSF